MNDGWSTDARGRRQMLKGLGDIGILMAAALVVFTLWFHFYHTIHPVAPLQFTMNHTLDLFRRGVAGLATFRGGLPRRTNFGIMSFFFVSIFHSHESTRMNRFRYVLYTVLPSCR